MPRSFTAGNGEMLVGLDAAGQLRDLYYPQVGLENHVGEGRRHRVGVYVDGEIHWLTSDDFVVSAETNPETQAGDVVARNKKIGITLRIHDVVYNERPVFIRDIEVVNEWDVTRDITLYFHQEFEIGQSRQASTAYFDPANQCLIHYRGRRVFLINVLDADGSFSQYTTGVSGIEGKEGSWRDAEDGELEENTIEHGPADSCLGIKRTYKGKEARTCHYWVAVGKSIQEVVDLNSYVYDRTPEHLQKTATDYWHAWLNCRPEAVANMSEDVQALFNRSLSVIRSHADDKGGILASSDSDMLQRGKDSYCYVWPRDGSYIVQSLDTVGAWNVSRRFFSFLTSVLTDEGYLMHKYGPDGSLGSSWHPWFHDGMYQLPIQEDETATALYALWNHYEESGDLEFIEKLYNPLIRSAANFLVSYRHDETNLPKRSYDLWEERIGVHTYTAASVYGGLQAAANFADLLGKSVEAQRYQAAAEEIKQGVMTYLYYEDEGYFVRTGEVVNEEFVQDRTVDFSSAFGIWHFGMLPADDGRLVSAMETACNRLGVEGVGGFARYEGDQYYRRERSQYAAVPGNPWFVTTLWYGQYVVDQAETQEDLEEVSQILQWVIDHTTDAGLLPEQLDLKTAERLSATPLVWSHAEFVTTVSMYLSKLNELE